MPARKRARAAATATATVPAAAPPPIEVQKVESRREKFLRLAQPRMQNALRSIRLLGNLASPTYEWTEADIAKMYATLQTAVEDHFARFKKEKPAKYEETFSFEKQEAI